ncbi:UNVERIFIED_CONTAM: Reticulon-like protein B5 [Sesamum radiatum]|uniref:Reticulon-like protein n=1 Tax=Sesamum radiatum TaxID=300843 RepID=A0AAW2ND04_SESRA
MADHEGEHEKHESAAESLVDKITEKFHGSDSSSSDSDDNKDIKSAAAAVKSKIYRLFGREKPVHKVLGGGKLVSYEYICFYLQLCITNCKINVNWRIAVNFFIKLGAILDYEISTEDPEIIVPEDIVLGVAAAFRIEFNRALAILRDIASGKELKKFLAVIAGLWVLSILGNYFNFLTLFYTCFVLLHTVPVLYEKYEDKVDTFAEKAEAELKKQYAVFNTKVLSKIPRGPLKDKKLL